MFEKVGKLGNCQIYTSSLIEQLGISCVAVDSTGYFLYAGSTSGTNILYTINNDNSLTKIGEHSSVGTTQRAQFHPTKNEIYICVSTQPTIPTNAYWIKYSYDKNTGIMTKIQEITTAAEWDAELFIDKYGKFFYSVEASTSTIKIFDLINPSATLNKVEYKIHSTDTNGSSIKCIAIHPTGNFLFVSYDSGANNSQVEYYKINKNTGLLTYGGFAFAGVGPFRITCDPSGNFLYAVNYWNQTGGNTVQAYTINQTTGALTSVGTTSAGTNPTDVICHPSGNFLYVVYSGTNIIALYNINTITGALTYVSSVSTSSTARSIVCDPLGKFLYLTTYGVESVVLYTINQSTGELTFVVAYPLPASSAALNLTCDPNGKFLYLSCQFTNTIRAYTINASTGALTFVAAYTTTESYPLGITCDPTGKLLWVANSGGNVAQPSLAGYTINTSTGALTFVKSILVSELTDSIKCLPSGTFLYASLQSTSLGDKIGIFNYNTGTQYTKTISVTSPFDGLTTIARGDNLGKWLYVGGVAITPISAKIQVYSINQTTGDLTAVGSAITVAADYYQMSVYDILIDKYNNFLYAIVDSVPNLTATMQIYAYSINQSTGALTFVGSYAAVNRTKNYSFSAITSDNKFLYFCSGSNIISVFSINQSTGELTLYNNYSFSGNINQLYNIPNKNNYFSSIYGNYVGLLSLYSDYSTSISSATKKINTKNKLPYDVKERITDPIKRNPVYWGN